MPELRKAGEAMIPRNVQVSAKTVRPFLQDKWFWWVDLDDDRYAYGESSSYADALGEMGEALKMLDEESGEVCGKAVKR